MEFKVQQLQIKAGKYKVVLRSLRMQKEIGVRAGTRADKRPQLPYRIAEIGDMISKGNVGVYQDVMR